MENEMDDLLRPRRNLIVVSTLLLIYQIAEVSFSTVKLLGTDVQVGNFPALMFCIWLILFYFLLRYYQYWKARPDRTILDAFERRFLEYGYAYADKLPQVTGFSIRRDSFANWYLLSPSYNKNKHPPIDSYRYKLPVLRCLLWYLKSALFVFFQTPHVTENVFPFLIAIAAIALKLLTIIS